MVGGLAGGFALGPVGAQRLTIPATDGEGEIQGIRLAGGPSTDQSGDLLGQAGELEWSLPLQL